MQCELCSKSKSEEKVEMERNEESTEYGREVQYQCKNGHVLIRRYDSKGNQIGSDYWL